MTPILTYHPLTTVERSECNAGPSMLRAQCGKCGKVFADSAVVSGITTVTGYRKVQRPGRGGLASGGCGGVPRREPVREFVPEQFEWSDEHRCSVMERRLYCDHCDHIMVWLEAVDVNPANPTRGDLTGKVVSGPGYLRGRGEIDRFLRKFPQAAGVVESTEFNPRRSN